MVAAGSPGCADPVGSSDQTLTRILAFASGSRSLQIGRVLSISDEHGQPPPHPTVTIRNDVRR